MGVIDNLFSKRPLVPPVPKPKAEVVDAIMVKSDEQDYKKKYEDLKKQQEKEELPKIELEQTEVEKDIKWFYNTYGATFAAQQPPANNETIIINLLYGCLIELRELNKKLDR